MKSYKRKDSAVRYLNQHGIPKESYPDFLTEDQEHGEWLVDTSKVEAYSQEPEAEQEPENETRIAPKRVTSLRKKPKAKVKAKAKTKTPRIPMPDVKDTDALIAYYDRGKMTHARVMRIGILCGYTNEEVLEQFYEQFPDKEDGEIDYGLHVSWYRSKMKAEGMITHLPEWMGGEVPDEEEEDTEEEPADGAEE